MKIIKYLILVSIIICISCINNENYEKSLAADFALMSTNDKIQKELITYLGNCIDSLNNEIAIRDSLIYSVLENNKNKQIKRNKKQKAIYFKRLGS